jgi:type I restriction enzyme S subunit
MAVKQGYKQTEVGVIPEDWEIVSIGALGLFAKGQGIRKDEANSGDLPCIRYGEIYTRHNDVIRAFFSWISEDIAQNSKRLKKGDILFAGSGETKEEIGKCVAFVGEEEAYAGGDIVILSPNKGASIFLGYLLNAPVVARQKASKGQGDAVVHISSSALSSIKIPFPPLREQQAIAEALSDVDGLISALDALIAKQRAIKHGAMQELLTGQRRLPGFAGEWEVKTLGEVVDFLDGKRKPIKDSDRAKMQGPYPYYGASGIIDYVNDYLFDDNLILLGEDGENIISRNSRLVFQIVGKVWVNNHAHVLKPKPETDVTFLTEYLESLDFAQYNTGTAQPKLNQKVCSLIPVMFPPLAEQTAIAQILADMDGAIAALVQKRAKTVALKQGMMQALLTGQMRLV